MPPRRTNGVHGPSSALTSFLRDQGITTRHGTGYRPNNIQDVPVPPGYVSPSPPGAVAGGEAAAPAAAPTTSDLSNAVAGPSTSASPSKRRGDELDPEQLQALLEEDAPVGKKRRVPKITSDSEDIDNSDSNLTPAQKKKKTLEKLAMKKRKEMAKAYQPDDDDDSDSDLDGEGYVPRRKTGGGVKTPAGPPILGLRMDCGGCRNQFSYSKYSPPAPLEPDMYLCHKCAKAAGLENYKGPKAAPKKKAERRQIVHYEARDRVPLLTDICISIVASHVEDVDSLGDIGPDNMRKVNNIICKNRKMTAQTATLFYDASVTDLVMKDCTLIDPPGFETLASLCPSLESLHLSLCGQLSSASLLSLARLQHLKRLELFAPFLVRKDAWAEFFEKMGERAGGGLEGFLVRNSPRLDEHALVKLVECNPGLKELRLSLVERFSELWLPIIGQLKHLHTLDISHPSRSLDGKTAVGGAPSNDAARGLDTSGLMSVNTGGPPPAAAAAAPPPPPHPPAAGSVNGAGRSTAVGGQTSPVAQRGSLSPLEKSPTKPTPAAPSAFVDLLESVGPGLTHLGLAGQSFLTPALLGSSVAAFCLNVTHVDLSEIPSLQDEETAQVLSAWSPRALVELRMRGCHFLGTRSLEALLAFEGELEVLDIAGWKDCSEEALVSIGRLKGRALRSLDLGWCRNVTDFTLKEIVDACPLLEQLSVWGCHLVTRNHPRRKGLKVVGVESHEFGSSAF